MPDELGRALIAMVVVSFALTTLDSATRLLRFNIEEIGASFRLPGTQNRYVSTIVACAAIALFAFYKVDGKPAGLALWALFGTTNQLPRRPDPHARHPVPEAARANRSGRPPSPPCS